MCIGGSPENRTQYLPVMSGLLIPLKLETLRPSAYLMAEAEGILLGAGSRHRTHDLLITSQLLYHLSYSSVVLYGCEDWNRTNLEGLMRPVSSPELYLALFGGSYEFRSRCLLIDNQTLSRLS